MHYESACDSVSVVQVLVRADRIEKGSNHWCSVQQQKVLLHLRKQTALDKPKQLAAEVWEHAARLKTTQRWLAYTCSLVESNRLELLAEDHFDLQDMRDAWRKMRLEAGSFAALRSLSCAHLWAVSHLCSFMDWLDSLGIEQREDTAKLNWLLNWRAVVQQNVQIIIANMDANARQHSRHYSIQCAWCAWRKYKVMRQATSRRLA